MTVTIRACAADDAEALAAMYAADRAELGDRDESFFTTAGQERRITLTWTEHNCVGFVIENEDRVVGLVILEDITDGAATVGYYVASTERGKGVATAAVTAVVPAARDLGLAKIYAEIDPDNLASLRVAERSGFREIGEIVLEGEPHIQFVVDL